MSKIYETSIAVDSDKAVYIVRLKRNDGEMTDVVVDRKVYDAIVELQREIWRLERRESRHCVHIEAIPDCYIPHQRNTANPEDDLIAKCERETLQCALMHIPEKQRRRFLLHHEYNLSTSAIAKIEGCSERSIQYSLGLAKRNLRDILEDEIKTIKA